MKRILLLHLLVLAFLGVPGLLWSSDVSNGEIERKVADLVAGQQVTVVHFWAPWCSNCESEMRPDGWAKFVRENPTVKVVFVAIWHEGQNATRKLQNSGLEGLENFLGLTHPNPSNARGEKLEQFLGLPLQWVPSTWVYREGKMRYALNYGEIRFEMLQQMVKDAGEYY